MAMRFINGLNMLVMELHDPSQLKAEWPGDGRALSQRASGSTVVDWVCGLRRLDTKTAVVLGSSQHASARSATLAQRNVNCL